MSFILDPTLKVAAILAVAFLALPLFRRQSASLRHGFLTVTLVVGAMAPLLSPALPEWHLTEPVMLPAVTVSNTATAVSTTITEMAAPIAAPSFSIQENLPLTVWIAGVFLSAVALLIGWLRLTRLASTATPLTDPVWLQTVRQISGEYGLRRSIRLLQSQNPSILVTWGLFRPTVLVPASAGQWAPDRVEIVLRHELAHVRRRDWLVQIVAESIRAIYWFNPLLWLACHRLRLESEFSCDDAVITRGVDGTDYAAHLLELARTLNQPDKAWSAALAMARRSTVERRFTAMLNPAINRRPVTLTATLAIVCATFCISLPLAAMTLSPEVFAPPPRVVTTIPQAPSSRLSGAVTDTRGAAVSGATVILTTPEGRTQGTTATNGTGSYSFAGIQPGAYVLQVFANGFGPSRMTNVNVESGKDSRQDLKLDIGFAEPAATTGGGSISGKVTDAAGLWVPGVQVTLASTDLAGGNRTVTTDAEGNYRFDSLPRGTYQTRTSLPGFKTLNIDGIRVVDNAMTVNARLQVATIAEEVTIKTSTSSSSSPSAPAVPPPACTQIPVSAGARGNRGNSELQIPRRSDGSALLTGGLVQQAQLIGQSKPIYPAEAKAQKVQGVVILEAVIGTGGNIVAMKIISGHSLLAQAAIDAVKQWCYRPTLLDGIPVEVVSTVTVNFALVD